MLRLPITLFPPGSHRWYPAGSALSGGTPISGPGQTADASAGGWWINDFEVAILRTLQQFAVWRALLGQLNSGVGLIEVPVLDILQPWPGGVKPALTPFTDEASFSDGGQFLTNPIKATLNANAYMPAFPAPPLSPTQLQIAISVGNPLGGGEYLSIIGPSGNVRLHMVTSVSDTTILGPTSSISTVTVIPPIREDMAAGTLVDFNDPRCTMKVDIASVADAWPTMTPPFLARPKIRFIEAGFVTPSEG